MHRLFAILTLAAIAVPGISPCSHAATAFNQKKAQSAKNQPAEPGATSTSQLALPFKNAWQYLTDSASGFGPTVAGERLFLPLAGGRVICLERQTGSLIWSSEPGGIVTAPVAVTGEFALIATKKLSPDGSDAGASLRAVDRETGLTRWSRDYPRAFTSPLEVSGSRIYVGSGDGALYAMTAGGEVLWKFQTQDRIRGQALATGDVVFFGGDDGVFRALGVERGNLVWEFQTGSKVACRPLVDDRFIYFGSGDGFFYALNRATGVVKWQSRTGAAVEAAPVAVDDRLLVSSFDNFIYCLSKESGNRIWKRRLDSRIAAPPVVEGDANLVAPLRGNYVAAFLNSDGKRVNLFQLDPGYEIVADPVFSGGMLLLATDHGLVAALPIQSKDSGQTARGSSEKKPAEKGVPQRPRSPR